MNIATLLQKKGRAVVSGACGAPGIFSLRSTTGTCRKTVRSVRVTRTTTLPGAYVAYWHQRGLGVSFGFLLSAANSAKDSEAEPCPEPNPRLHPY